MSKNIDPANVEKWSLGNIEVGLFMYHPKPYGPSSGTLKLNIPKLMPMISGFDPKITVKSINKSCYINDSACKPSVGTTINTQNYKSVPPQDNREFKKPVFWRGDRIFVEIRNGNLDTMFLSTKEDNSTDPP